ncbi:MAG TPA: hypothetical protein VF247_01150 [Candidatus Krumholzibacteria bacterium]
MRTGRRVRLIGAACAFSFIALSGCAKTTTCEISPVELEELREDIAVLQKDLKTAKDRETALTNDLATKKADLESKKAKPAELRAQLDAVKKGAGKTEKAKEPKDAAKKGSS